MSPAPSAVPDNLRLAVETRGLCKYFGAFRAVDDLNLSVREGEVFGFLGSNGAGKSTAIRVLCGLLTPSGGSAVVLGVDVAHSPETVKRQIGYMSQRFSLYDDLTVGQNLRFFGGVYGLEGRAYRERAAWALSMAGLEGREQQLTRGLAGGWKQRLALACGVLHRPRILFLDEPTGGVDPISRRRFWMLIDEMSAQGVTVIVTTHYMDEAEHCDRIALMHAGRLVAEGSVTELKQLLAGQSLLEVICPNSFAALEGLEREPWVAEASVFGTRLHVVLHSAEAADALLIPWLNERGFSPAAVARIVPSLEDVFIHAIERGRAGTASVGPVPAEISRHESGGPPSVGARP